MNLFEIENVCLCIGPLPEADDDQNRPQSRSPCGILVCAYNDQTDLGWKQLLSDKHSMALWNVLLLVVVCFMSK